MLSRTVSFIINIIFALIIVGLFTFTRLDNLPLLHQFFAIFVLCFGFFFLLNLFTSDKFNNEYTNCNNKNTTECVKYSNCQVDSNNNRCRMGPEVMGNFGNQAVIRS